MLLGNGSLSNTYPAKPIDQVSSSVTSSTGTSITFGTMTTSSIVPSITSALWTLQRVGNMAGPTGPFTDSWDTAANIISAVNNSAGTTTFATTGQSYRVRVCNTTNYAETILPTGASGTPPSGMGVTSYGTTIVAAGSCTNFTLELAGSPVTTVNIVGGS